MTARDEILAKVRSALPASVELPPPFEGLRFGVRTTGCSGLAYKLEYVDENSAEDQVFESHGVKLFVDPISVRYLKGAEVDFVDTVTGGGFTIKNPNATSTCGCGQSFSVD